MIKLVMLSLLSAACLVALAFDVAPHRSAVMQIEIGRGIVAETLAREIGGYGVYSR